MDSLYMKRRIFAIPLFLVMAYTSAVAQSIEEPSLRNYELRNLDFQDRRQLPHSVNFASEYTKAYQELKNSPSVLYKAGAEWTPVGPFGNERLAGNGRINSMQVLPSDSNTWFICVAQGGVWKTTNAGDSWIHISGDLPILRTSSLAIDPNNPDIMYVALGDYAYLGHNLQANENKRSSHYGIGIYKTINGGQNWEATGLSFDQLDFEGSLIAKIIINPSDPSQILAVGQTGVFLSEDSAATWKQTNTQIIWDLEMDPQQDSVLYASTGYVHTYGIGEASIIKSTDFGNSWTVLNSGIPLTGLVQRIALAIAPSDNQYIYGLACDTLGGFYGFYKSVNGGQSFTQTLDHTYDYNILNSGFNQVAGGQGRYDLALCVDKNDKNHVLTGGINIWHTKDGGDSFTPLTFWRLNYDNLSLHADIHEITQHPYNSSYFVAHDGGLSRSFKLEQEDIDSLIRNKVKTQWTHYSKGLNITSFYRLSVNTLNASEKIAGSQDNSTVFTDGSSFSNLSGGDGMESVFMDDLGYRYTSSQNGRLYVYTLNNGSYRFHANISPPNKEFGEWTTPFVRANNKLYVLFGNLYSYVGRHGGGKHSNFSFMKDKWYPVKGSALAIEEHKATKMYVAKRPYNSLQIENEVWRSDNGGEQWTDISEGLPRQHYPSYLELNQSNPSEVWAVFSGFDSLNKVFYSSNSGDTWNNITYDLPNIPVNCVEHQNDGTGLIYIGTDIGVFYLKKDTTNWVYYSEQLPKVIVSELEVDTANKTLVAATFGRGLWEVELKDYRPRTAGIDRIDAPISFSLYPNPTSDIISINLEGRGSLSDANIKIIDITGSVLYDNPLDLHHNKTTFDLDVSTYLPGEYFVIVTVGNRRYVEKFIVL